MTTISQATTCTLLTGDDDDNDDNDDNDDDNDDVHLVDGGRDT